MRSYQASLLHKLNTKHSDVFLAAIVLNAMDVLEHVRKTPSSSWGQEGDIDLITICALDAVYVLSNALAMP